MARHILARLLRRGPTRDEAFDRFAGKLGGTPPAHGPSGGAPAPAERGFSPWVSLDAAMREQARAGERELIRSVPPGRAPAPATGAAPTSPGAAAADSDSRTAPQH